MASYRVYRYTGISKEDEKADVKRGMEAELRERDTWQVFSSRWFNNWKKSVGFDQIESPEQKDDSDCREIDNSAILDREGLELKRGLTEGLDYVLVTEDVGEKLHVKYGGPGPRIRRQVVNVGTLDATVLQIELFPIRVDLYYSGNAAHDPTSQPVEVRLFPKNSSLEAVGKVLRERKHGIYDYKPFRVWVKTTSKAETVEVSGLLALSNEDVDETKGSLMEPSLDVSLPSKSPSPSSEMEIIPEQQGPGQASTGSRRMTREVTEHDGPWRLIRDFRLLTLDYVRSGRSCVEMMVEFATYQYSPRENEWERFKLLSSWKCGLQVGDIIDVKLSYYDYAEAVVTAVAENGSVSIHLKGLDRPDFTILKYDIADKIEPLYSKTKDWRSRLEEDDVVDVRAAPASAPGLRSTWVKATVQEVDLVARRVLVQYAHLPAAGSAGRNADDDLKKNNMNLNDELDDEMEVIHANNSSTSPAATTTSPSNAPPVSNVSVNAGEVSRWLDLDGDDVCPVYTHVVKPYGAKNYNKNDDDDSYSYGEQNVVGKPVAKGSVGLKNLGNTCYMASVLQCATQMQPLTELFLAGGHKPDLNPDNVLGSGCSLVKAYAKLLKEMWSENYSTVIPRGFKTALSNFNPQFVGWNQQDSQEALGSLLDGLHEDINRVKQKPAVQKIESKGRPDETISRESWRRFFLRNDSALVDTCYGQLKSHVSCMNPTCGSHVPTGTSKASVTFEAFSCLSLPVPVSTKKPVKVTVMLLPPHRPLVIEVEMAPGQKVSDLKVKIARYLTKAGKLSTQLLPLPDASLPPPPPSPDSQEYVKIEKEDCVEAQCAGTATGEPQTVVEGKEDVDSSSDEDSDVPLEFSEAGYRSRTAAILAACAAIGAGGSAAAGAAVGLGASPGIVEPIFHVCTVPKYYRYMRANQWDAVAVDKLLTSGDDIYLQQLTHPCPITKNVPYKAHVAYIDLWVGTWEPRYGARSIGYHGTPFRIAVTAATTGHELSDMVWPYFRRFMKPTSTLYDNPAKRPFTLHTADLQFKTVRQGIPDDDSPMRFPMTDTVLAILTTDADQIINLDLNEFKNLDYVDSEDVDAAAEDEEEENDSCADARTASKVGGGGGGAAASQQKKVKAKGLSIYKCFEKFTENEQLAEEETLYCSQCKLHSAPSKKMDIWATPDILVIHLKRFHHTQGYMNFVQRQKITELVDFPISGLDLTAFVKGPQNESAPPVYDLFAVSNHIGSLNGGHYTAVAKNFLNGKWYNCDDEYVSETTAGSAVTAAAYVLFYKRRTGSLKWAGLTPHSAAEAMPDED